MDLYLTPWETWTSERGLRRENTVPKILKKKRRERDLKYVFDGDLGEEMLQAL